MPVRKVLLILIAIALVVALVPVKSLDCPAWDVWLVDRMGQPVAGMTVRLSYRNYSAEDEDHQVDETSDQSGHASFAAQTISVSRIRRCLSTLRSAIAGVHASFGPHADVFAFGKGLEGFNLDLQRNIVVTWTGGPKRMESRIVVRPRMF
jgi:hypothetical protein